MTKCIVCGCLYEPIRKNQPCCPDAECKRKWRLIYAKEYARNNYPVRGVSKQEYKREKARQYRARERGEEYIPIFERGLPIEEPEKPKCFEATNYAERQRLKTLAMVGKVQI